MTRRLSIFVLTALLLLAGTVQPATAQVGNTWRVDFYPNPGWTGAPVYTQYTNFADFNWGRNAPGPNMPSENWSARLSTDAFFYSGIYRFTLLADDSVRVRVNGVTYFDNVDRPAPGKTFVIDVPLSQGTNNISVDFLQWSGPAYLHISWQYVKPGGGQTVYPPAIVPTPQPPVTSVPSISNKYGDFTPCIQQNIHQSNCFHGSGEWNSPNLGSISMEPQIVIWQACKADEDKVQVVDPNQDPRPTRCSKTEAGWFPS